MYITSYLRDQMPVCGNDKKTGLLELYDRLNDVFNAVLNKCNLSSGDFPPFNIYKDKLDDMDFSKFPKLDQKLIAQIDDALGREVPMILKKYPMEDEMSCIRTRSRGNNFDSTSRSSRPRMSSRCMRRNIKRSRGTATGRCPG